MAVLPPRRPSPRSGTPTAMVEEIMEVAEKQPHVRLFTRALQIYQHDLRKCLAKDNMNIKDVMRQTRHTPVAFYTALMHYAIRISWYHVVEELMDDMVRHGVTRPLSFYESTMKQLAGQKQHHVALAVYDRLEADGLRPSAVTCSCLVSFAVEVGELQRALEFFEKLSATTTPSIRAYMTVLRVHAKRQDFAASVALFRDMERRCAGVDSLALNVVLGTGVAADELEAVDELLRQADARQPPIADVISYNTLLKALAQRCDAERARAVIPRMKARGLEPNHITYNTAMDATVRAGRLPEAWPLLDAMRDQGLSPDKFTASIIVKGLSRSPGTGQVKNALALLRDTDSVCDGALKASLYHAVFEAARQAAVSEGGGDMAIAARTFTQMRQCNVTPSQAVQRFMMHALPSASC